MIKIFRRFNIEANIAPLEGTTNGTLVVDGSIPYYNVGVIIEPVLFEIDKGYVQITFPNI